MKEILLSQGKIALVDDDDFKHVSKHHWCARKNKDGNNWYAMTSINHKTVYMHRFVMGEEFKFDFVRWAKQIIFRRKIMPHYVVDHINRNGLDNQKHNLRLVDNSTNIRNSRRSKQNQLI